MMLISKLKILWDGVEVYIDVKEKENVNDLLKKDGLLVSNDTIPMDTKATVSNIRISGLKKHI